MRRALAALALALAPGRAGASPFETFGLFPQDEGRAGAGVAARDAVAAALLNPAASAQPGRGGGQLSYRYAHLGLRLQGRDAGVMDAHGFQAATGQPFALGPFRLGFALGVHLPDQFLAQVTLEPASRARFVMFEGRVHRLVVNTSASIQLARGVFVGLGVTGLASATGAGVSLRTSAAPGRDLVDAAVDAALPLRLAPVLGVLVVPSERVAFGLRGSTALDFSLSLDVVAAHRAQGGATAPAPSGDAVASFRGVAYYTPAELVGGAMVAVTPRWRWHAELAYRRWSAVPSASGDAALVLAFGGTARSFASERSPPGYRDIVVPRVATEVDLPLGATTLTLRGGYSFVPTPVPDQTGATSDADGDRHAVTLGASLAFGAVAGTRLSVHAALGWQHVVPFTATKREVLAPGGDLAGSGEILSGSLGVRVER